jgi:GT2 family glycosyltransferase
VENNHYEVPGLTVLIPDINYCTPIPRIDMRTSFLIPVYNTELAILRLCINSVLKAAGDEHEVVVVDDASDRAETREFLLRCVASGRDNLKVIRNVENSGVSYSLNKAAEAATGILYAPVDHDDMVVASGFEQMLRYQNYYGIGWAYSDELQISHKGIPINFMYKPEFCLQLLRSLMYINHLQLIPSPLFESVGGYREGFEGSQDHDLALRLSEEITPVHVDALAYLWRRGNASMSVNHGRVGDSSIEASHRALEEHFERLGITAQVTPFHLQPMHEALSQPTGTFISRILPKKIPKVSIIIPCKLGTTVKVEGKLITILPHCLQSIRLSLPKSLQQTMESPEVEIILVLNHDDDMRYANEVISKYELQGYSVCDSEGFNFSRKCNLGADLASGDILVFLNDDIDMQTVGWTSHVISLLQEEDVAVVGGMLQNVDRTVQSCGDNVGRYSAVHYVPEPIASNVGDAMHRYIADHETTSVTGAFLCCRKDTFKELNGFSTAFPNSFQDVDFCLRSRSQDLRCIISPHVKLLHFESASRNPHVDSPTLSAVRQLHGQLIGPVDPFGLAKYEKVKVTLFSLTGLRYHLGQIKKLTKFVVVHVRARLVRSSLHPRGVLSRKDWRVH